LDPPYDIKLVLCRKLHFFLGKSTKTAGTRAALFESNMHQIVSRLGLRLRPTGGACGAPPSPLLVFRGPTFKGRKREGKGREVEDMSERRRGERRGEGRVAIKHAKVVAIGYTLGTHSAILCVH